MIHIQESSIQQFIMAFHNGNFHQMVSIGTHSLSVSLCGEPSAAQDLIVVFLTGAGDVASSCVVVARLIAPFARILLYDRSGLGKSERSPRRTNAVTAAEELHLLVQAIPVTQTLLLVGHSYGGIVAREYLHLHPEQVAGMVLADSSTERQNKYFQVPDPNISAVLGDLNFAQVTGLREESKLSRDEWRERAIDISKGLSSMRAEAAAFVEVCESLGEKEQYKRRALGSKPLSVIRCNSAREYERIYAKGVEIGNGTEEQKKAFRLLLDRWEEVDRNIKEEQLQLSSNSRLVHLPDCGHYIHLVRPDLLVKEIIWVRDQILGGMSSL